MLSLGGPPKSPNSTLVGTAWMLNQAHAPQQHSTVFGSNPKMSAMSSTHVSAVRCIAATAAAAVVVHFRHNRQGHFSIVLPRLSEQVQRVAPSVAERDLQELRLGLFLLFRADN